MYRSILGFLILPLLLFSCESRKGRICIDTQLQNINQADLLIYSPDGAFPDIDTLHLIKGRTEKEIALKGGPYTFIILYPNMASIQFMASEGQKVKIRGDVQMVGQERITGCDSVIRLDSMPQYPPLRIGQPMPKDSVLQAVYKKGKPLLVAFWANWKGGGSSVNYNLRQAKKLGGDSLTMLSYCLDVDYNTYNNAYRTPDTSYVEHCDFFGLQSPLFRRLKLNNIPYYILYDKQGNIKAHGSDYQRDISSKLKTGA